MSMLFTHNNYCINSTVVSLLLLPHRYGHLEVVRYLVTDGNCDPNAKNRYSGCTPLHLACM